MLKDFKNDFVNLKKGTVFGKIMENVRKHRDNKLVKIESRGNYLVFKANYNRVKNFQIIC